MVGHAKVLGRVGRHQDDATTLVEMTIGLACDKKLAPRVQAKDAVKLFLLGCGY